MQAAAETSEISAFSKYWLILKRRWLPAGAVAAILFSLMCVKILKKPNTYQASGQIRLNIEDSAPKITGIEQPSTSSSQEPDRSLDTEIQSMISREFLSSVVQKLPKSNAISVEDLQGGLKILPVKETNVVEVSFESLEPRAASQVVNQLLQAYVQSNLKENQSKSKATREFILKQLPQVRQRVFIADSALRQFQKTSGVVSLDATKTAVAGSQAKLQDQLSAVETQLADVNSQLALLRRQLGVDTEQAIIVSSIGQSPAVQDILKSVQETQKQLREAKSRFAPDHPTILDLQDRERELQALLQERIRGSVKSQDIPTKKTLFVGATQQGLLDSLIKNDLMRTGLIQQQQVLINQKTAYANQITLIPELERRQRELERELEAAESTYKSFLKSLQDIQVTEQQTAATVRIIDPALVPLSPSGPNRGAELIRSAIAAVLAGSAVAYLLEVTERKFKSVESILEVYPYPLLGNIPFFDIEGQEYRQLPVFSKPHSAISEAYRMLQANLKFLNSDSLIRVITVTSADSEEGKSVTASNLGAVLSQLGHFVLIIDADLRRPTTHKIWEISNRLGLADVLQETEDSNFENVPIQTINDHLKVLTAGSIKSNPLVLFNSPRMNDFLKVQIKKFDYVIIDTPPISVAVDPLVIGSLTDGILLVARPENLEKGLAKNVRNTLLQSGSKILGIVANAVRSKNDTYGYYNYSSNYYTDNESNDRVKNIYKNTLVKVK